MGDKESHPANEQVANNTKKLLNCVQSVSFCGSGDLPESHELCCTDVKITGGRGNHTSGSSKVALKNMVDFTWELRSYPGQLIAVHISGNYLAYGIKGMNKQSDTGTSSMIRIMSRLSGERTLIRGMKGMVQDLAFAHLAKQMVLACVDQQGSLFVHSVEEKGSKLICTLILHIEREEPDITSEVHRVVWCPYIPEEGIGASTDSEVGQLLVQTCGTRAEMWCVPIVVSHNGPGPLRPGNVKEGLLRVPKFESAIMDAAFSPDGSALAIATVGGLVSFFQVGSTALLGLQGKDQPPASNVYMHNNTVPRCLHTWRPHGVDPLSSLFFLDNHRDHHVEKSLSSLCSIQFWKYAITGAKDNSEIKIWACETWTCLQTLSFEPAFPHQPGDMVPSPNGGRSHCILKAALDDSSRYLILSDIYNRMLYVLQVEVDPANNESYISVISGFTLQQPALSFGIADAGVRASRPVNEGLTSDGEDDDDEDSEDDAASSSETTGPIVVVRMYMVQPKSLQECRVAFKTTERAIQAKPALSNHVYRNSLGEVPVRKTTGEKLAAAEPDSTITSVTAAAAADLPANQISADQLNASGGALNLMTPDAFSSPARHEESPSRPSSSGNSTNMCQPSPSTSMTSPPCGITSSAPPDLTQVTPPEVQPSTLVREPREGLASGGSSPSREVQQILALKDEPDMAEDFYEEDKDLTEALDQVKEQSIKVGEEEDDDEESGVGGGGNISMDKQGTAPLYSWPQIPQIPLLVSQDMESNETEPKRQVVTPPVLPAPPHIVPDLPPVPEMVWMDLRLLQNSMQTLVSKVEEQQQQITGLRSEIVHSNTQVNASLEGTAAAAMERAASRQIARLGSQLDAHRRESEIQNSQLKDRMADMRESLATSLTQSLDNVVAARLPTTFSSEVQAHLVPVVLKTLQPLKELLHQEVAQKLTASDHLLQENLARLVNSKSLHDSLGATLAQALQHSMASCFREVMLATIVPSFEKCCQKMFTQLNEAFSQGTKEHLAAVEAQLEKQRQRNTERNKDMSAQIHALGEAIRLSREQTASFIRTELSTNLSKAVNSLQEPLCQAVREAVQEPLNRGLREQHALLEGNMLRAKASRPATPRTLDPQAQQVQVLTLVKQGQLNAAFQQALSASDLALVVLVCERVNPQQVFNQTPCPLQQPVLLSLIQQLSADLGNHTELKHKYLEEAVMNLDTENMITRDHLPAVLTALQKQLSGYISSNPNNRITRSMRMLMMATTALLKG